MDDEARDFDPTRLLDGWRAEPRPAPPELDLGALLQGLGPGGTGPDAERLRRPRARGYEMRDIQDIEEIELRVAPPASAPELPALQLASPRRAADPRLLGQWQPGAWIAACRRISGAQAELHRGPQGPLLENHAPQWLLALWPPQGLDRPLLSRWPAQLRLLALEDDQVAGALLAAVPPGARLWRTALGLDWALLAEIVLHHEPGLRPAQAQALRALAEAERLAQFERLNDAYARAADGAILLRPEEKTPVR